VDGARRLISQLHAQPTARGRDAQVLVAHATDDVEGLPRRLLERQPERVGVHALLDRRAHVRRRLEEAVRGHQPIDALVRPLEVVRVDVQTKPTLAVGVVAEDRTTQKLLPQRLPETLHLAQRLRVLRPALDVRDALTTKLLLEVRLAAPRRVLAPLVGEDLARRAPRRDRALQCLHHQRRALVVRHRPAHHEARVVVHEGRDVQTLVPAEQKREDVRLPHLVGSRPLEAPRRVLACRRGRRRLGDEPLLVQDATHLRLADAERSEAGKDVTNTTRAPLGVLLPLGDHRVVLDLRAVAAGSTRPAVALLG
jgi:hypothetical protein